jgi:3-hydroxybutyryl-CoA dehydrogenase
MKIGVITDQVLKEELLAQGLAASADIVWMDKPALSEGVNHYLDLLYTPIDKNNYALNHYKTGIVIVNDVTNTLQEQPENFVRINGWPTFLKRPIVEAASCNETMKSMTESIFSVFNKKVEWVADNSGFITARVVSMIINEAYLLFEEKVSSKDEIDIAMKLGTNYTYGPFEWSEKIGKTNIVSLLIKLEKEKPGHQPAHQLILESSQ